MGRIFGQVGAATKLATAQSQMQDGAK